MTQVSVPWGHFNWGEEGRIYQEETRVRLLEDWGTHAGQAETTVPPQSLSSLPRPKLLWAYNHLGSHQNEILFPALRWGLKFDISQVPRGGRCWHAEEQGPGPTPPSVGKGAAAQGGAWLCLWMGPVPRRLPACPPPLPPPLLHGLSIWTVIEWLLGRGRSTLSLKVSWKVHLCDEIQGFYSFVLALGEKAQAYLSCGVLTPTGPAADARKCSESEFAKPGRLRGHTWSLSPKQ